MMMGCSCCQVYNLPETVRESDVEKLSFAVQLADGFYATSQVRPCFWWECLCTCLCCRPAGDIHAGSPPAWKHPPKFLMEQGQWEQEGALHMACYAQWVSVMYGPRVPDAVVDIFATVW